MVDKKKLGRATLENVRLVFRNFGGKEGQYNAAGQRNFCVILPQEVADQMAADGYNVKYLKPREEDDGPTPYIKINVNFGGRPPQVVMISSKGRTNLDEKSVDILDWARFTNVDLSFSPNVRDWPDGRTTVTAYLSSIFATIEEDELERKYADVPDSAQSSVDFVPDFQDEE